MADPFPARFTLLGPRWAADAPLWSAQVAVLTETNARSARTAFVSSEPRDVEPGVVDLPTHLPGTLPARIRVESVRVGFGATQSNEFPAAVRTDATVLVAATPAGWTPDSGSLAIKAMRCIAGQFPLDNFFGPVLATLPELEFFRAALRGIFPHFPDGVNLEVGDVTADDTVTLRVRERGVGETLACGTGACAVGAAFRAFELTANAIWVVQPGGTARVALKADQATLIGSTTFVASIEVPA